MSDNIVVNIDFRGNQAQFLAELSRAVGRAKSQLQDMGQATSTLSRLENQLARLSSAANQNASATARAAASVQGWSQKWTPFKGQFMEAEASSNALWRSIDKGIASAEGSLGRATKAIHQFDESQRVAAQKRVGGNQMADWDAEFRRLSQAADDNAAKVKKAQQAIEQYQNSLSNSRYVLYDVAGTLGIMGAGLIAPLAAVVGVAANFEREFAQVARTSGLTGDALGKLKGDFDDLYGSLPLTYDALADIATLAGQLGVPAQDIAKFTETVAKTSAVTDLSVDAAATAFGRLNALIPNVKGQYDRLGSAIALVGVNSVATESEIVNISTQISSMGSFAGLTAQDIIGLSGALASIGAQPELSRGTVTRVFTLMSRAVAGSGDSLAEFARVSGVSSQEFADSWGTPAFTQTFLGFMNGIREEGGNAVGVLNDLGITSVRDVPLLLRLANAADETGKAGALLAQTIGDANRGWSENNELQRQYDIIAGTVAARFEVLTNNLNLFLQAIGGPALEGLAEFISFLTDTAKMATDFASTDLGGTFIRISVGLAAVLGVLSLAGAAFALFGASSIGIYQGLQFIAAASPRAAAALVGTAGAAALADGSMKASAASAALLKRALGAITIVGALLALPEVIRAAGGAIDDLTGKNQSLKGSIRELGDDFSAPFVSMIQTVGGARNVFTDFTNGLSSTGRAFMEIDDALKSMADSGDIDGLLENLNAISDATGLDGTAVLDMFSGVRDKAKEAGLEIFTAGDKLVGYATAARDGAAGSTEAADGLSNMEEEAAAAAAAIDDLRNMLDALSGNFITIGAAQDALQSSINSAVEALKEEGVTFDGTNEQSIRFRDSLREVDQRSKDVALSMVENGKSTDEAAAAWQGGRERLLDLIQGFFSSREEAAKWADENVGSAAEVRAAIESTSQSVNNMPTSKNIVITATTAAAQGVIDGFIRANDGRRITIYATTQTGNAASMQANGRGYGNAVYASGGSVWGPGTGTSDSIFARLSNGEFVVRAQAASAIGHGRLNYMNQTGKLPAFATGGSVGRAPSGGNFSNSMIVELSPTDRMLLAQAGNVTLSIDGREIANAANSANFVSSRRGSN